MEIGNSLWSLCHVTTHVCFGPEFDINAFSACQFLSPPVLYCVSTGCLIYSWISSFAKPRTALGSMFQMNTSGDSVIIFCRLVRLFIGLGNLFLFCSNLPASVALDSVFVGFFPLFYGIGLCFCGGFPFF